jgi:hypothetical protein
MRDDALAIMRLAMLTHAMNTTKSAIVITITSGCVKRLRRPGSTPFAPPRT